jgi:phage shock protein PspC (stress-responsive transcriptional regulator)
MENPKDRIDTAYMILIFGFLGVLAQIFGILPTLIVILIVLGLTGAAVSYFLPENSEE